MRRFLAGLTAALRERLPGLDLVRAVAIAWVMLYHASILWHVPGDSWIVRLGWMGVDLFFLLSGFLIAGQLLQPLWQFLTFTQNLALDPTPRKVLSHAWSLCVEEQFYLVFPLVVAGLALRPGAIRAMAAIAAVLLFGSCIRAYLWTHEVATVSQSNVVLKGSRFMSLIYYPTWSRLDGLLSGVVAALIQTFRPGWWRLLTAKANLLSL